ncbi:MAG: glycerol acyltransferase [Bacteroidetes bacterium HGW-Bacteroidetes-8]|jgi:putative hemolysin|nr:MAG: glycerol acyltransferase [Bacteroidetes bacterium HGW-Bacteroidetes-8]
MAQIRGLHKDKMRIDIERVIAGKNPRLLKVIPKFFINWLKRLIRQDFINEILSENGHLRGAEFAHATLKKLNIKYIVHGIEKLNKEGNYIIASNHPLGGLDGVVLIDLFGKFFDNIKFVVNDLLYNIEPLKPVFIPVNKFGKQSTEIAKMITESYNYSNQVLYFPAGLCSRLTNGVIEDLEWKKSYITQALKHKRDILPVFFEGRNSGLFYKIANIRKRLGIKFNYEFILLPREMFRQQNSEFNVYIGDPFTYRELSAERSAGEWNKIIRERVYTLKNQLWKQ